MKAEIETIRQDAIHLLNVWNTRSKQARNKLKRELMKKHDPAQFAAVFEAIQTIHCEEYTPNPKQYPKRKL